MAAIDPSTGKEPNPWDAQISGQGQVQVRAVLPLGQAVYVGGQFSGAGGENRGRVGSVHPAFGAASGWDPGADGPIDAIAHSDKLVIIGGEFSRLGLHGANPNPNTSGQPVPYLAAFNALPAIRPVNHLLDDGRIIIRTRLAASISAAVRSESALVVAYEADSMDPQTQTGWSVVATGRAYTITDPAEILRYEQQLHPWVNHADTAIAIEPTIVSGFRINGAA